MSETNDARFQIRLSKEDRNRLKAAAALQGVTTESLIRQAALSSLEPGKTQDIRAWAAVVSDNSCAALQACEAKLETFQRPLDQNQELRVNLMVDGQHVCVALLAKDVRAVLAAEPAGFREWLAKQDPNGPYGARWCTMSEALDGFAAETPKCGLYRMSESTLPPATPSEMATGVLLQHADIPLRR